MLLFSTTWQAAAAGPLETRARTSAAATGQLLVSHRLKQQPTCTPRRGPRRLGLERNPVNDLGEHRCRCCRWTPPRAPPWQGGASPAHRQHVRLLREDGRRRRVCASFADRREGAAVARAPLGDGHLSTTAAASRPSSWGRRRRSYRYAAAIEVVMAALRQVIGVLSSCSPRSWRRVGRWRGVVA